jgi:hypothetical protein
MSNTSLDPTAATGGVTIDEEDFDTDGSDSDSSSAFGAPLPSPSSAMLKRKRRTVDDGVTSEPGSGARGLPPPTASRMGPPTYGANLGRGLAAADDVGGGEVDQVLFDEDDFSDAIVCNVDLLDDAGSIFDDFVDDAGSIFDEIIRTASPALETRRDEVVIIDLTDDL